MHCTLSIHRFPVRLGLALLAVLSLATVGCPNQGDLPAELNLVVPPTPTNFVITRVDPQDYDYDFAWEVSDPTAVDYYRVYLVGNDFVSDELLFETPNTTYLATFSVSLTGLQFAVSSVSAGGVEGQRTVETVE